MNKYFPKEVIHMAKRNPPALIIREMLIDSKVKNSLWKWLLKSRQEITSASEGLEKKEYLFTVAGNAIQSSNYEKQYRISTHTHTKIELSYDPTIPLLGIYPKKTKTLTGKDTCIPMLISALFTIIKIWKNLSVNLWRKG